MGQAWRVDFSAGGLIPNSKNLPTGTVHPPTIAQVFGLQKPHPISGNATVIVIDRFTSVPITSTAEAPYKTGRKVTLDVRHGALVTQHLQAMLASDGFKLRSAGGQSLKFTRDTDGRTVTVLALDFGSSIQSRQTTNLARQFNAMIHEVQDPVVIVNMSFVLIKCDVLQAIIQKHREEAGRRYTLDTYLDDLEVGKSPAERKAATTAKAIFQVDPKVNPLLKAIARAKLDLAKAQPKRTFVAVAASGNFDDEVEPLWPGAAESVISVGATNWLKRSPGLPLLRSRPGTGEPEIPAEHPWSSPGDATAVGEWYTLDTAQLSGQCASQAGNPQAVDPWCAVPANQLLAWPNFAYRGTSFSAPSLSALLASRLASGQAPSDLTRCLPDAKNLANQAVNTRCF